MKWQTLQIANLTYFIQTTQAVCKKHPSSFAVTDGFERQLHKADKLERLLFFLVISVRTKNTKRKWRTQMKTSWWRDFSHLHRQRAGKTTDFVQQTTKCQHSWTHFSFRTEALWIMKAAASKPMLFATKVMEEKKIKMKAPTVSKRSPQLAMFWHPIFFFPQSQLGSYT